MKADELRAAAAERLASNCWTTYLGEHPRDWPAIVDAILLDARVLADAYRAANTADDGLPVTREWLESVGFAESENKEWMQIKNIQLAKSVCHYPGAWLCAVGGVWWKECVTRRDVRRLLAALGIDVPAKGA